MKSIVIVILATLAVAQAREDWDNILHEYINPEVNGEPLFREEWGNERVVGGQEVVPHSRPFQVALFIDWGNGQTVFCGGSLISTTVVLTAAHCVTSKYGIVNVEVVLGAHNIRENESNQVHINTTEYIVHRRWNSLFLVNDIALVKLPQPVELNENIGLATLPSRSDKRKSFSRKRATVSGWGKDKDSAQEISPVLRQASNPIMTNLACSMSTKSPYSSCKDEPPCLDKYPLRIRSSHLCVSGRRGHSSCSGDSGGPLTIERDGEVIQVGVVSFGIALGCSWRFPHVYTRVTEYLDWIQDNAGIIIN